MIRHLVCSGSGPNCLTQASIILEYQRRGLLSREKLDKIYGCSAGAIIGMFVLLDIPMESTVKYVIERPWHKLFKLDLVALNERGGMMDNEKIKEMITPLFLAFDIPLDITFAQARVRSNIDLHVFSTCLITLETVDFNVETFPNMPLLTAVTLSCAVPPVFSVGSYEGRPYADGGLSNNFPLVRLLADAGDADPATVLCINMTGPLPEYRMGMPLTDLMFYLMTKAFLRLSEFYLNHETAEKLCEHYIYFGSESIISKSLWEKFLYSEDERRVLYDRGLELARAQLDRVEAKHANLVCEAERC